MKYFINTDDFGIQLMKTQNSCLKKLAYFIRPIKEVFLIKKKKRVNLQIIVFSYALNTWSGILLQK